MTTFLPRDLRSPTAALVASMVVTFALGAVSAALLTAHHPDAADFRAAALVAALIAATCFVGAVVLAVMTGRLLPALWGYVPGLAAVLVAGIWFSASSTAREAGGIAWGGFLIVLNPLFWVPIVAAVVVLRRRASNRSDD